jgi:large subunit ribosomal protein L21
MIRDLFFKPRRELRIDAGADRTMYAVIKTGGKQYRVANGETLKIETLVADVGSTVAFEEVLLVGEGDAIKVGAPVLTGSSVKAEVLAHGRGDKIRIVKHRRRKHYHKEQGHRQNFTQVKITEILA